MKRVTVKNGKLSRSVTIVEPPYPKVGDEVTFKGAGAKWFVSKVRDVGPGVLINLLRGTAKLKS